MSILDALLINSYAGSLVLGVQQAGIPIRGSYEDADFGMAAQKLNFPEIPSFRSIWPWGSDDLSSTIVLAHPPCSAFSNNTPADLRGLGTEAFCEHRRVMDHAMAHSCAALAIESVPGLLKFRDEYVKYGEKFSYNLFFIHLDASSFGVPQHRERVWVLFFRELGRLSLAHEPTTRVIADVLHAPSEVVEDATIRHLMERFVRKFDSAGFDWKSWLAFDNVGAFVPTVAEFLNVENTRAIVDQHTGTKGAFAIELPRKLDVTGLAPVIMERSLWLAHGRPLTRIEYHRIMGFPDDFKWPATMEKNFLRYLSKGVCPPVATWIAHQMIQNLEGALPTEITVTAEPGAVADVRPEKNTPKKESAIIEFAQAKVAPVPEMDIDPQTVTRTRSSKLRMPREDQIAYIAPLYLRRLRDTRRMMADCLEEGQGTATEIQRRIDKLDELIGLVKTGTHEAAAEFVIKNGITSSLLQGGGGYPTLTGSHFDYITTCFPNRTREMRRRIGERGEIAWSKKDRMPRLAG